MKTFGTLSSWENCPASSRILVRFSGLGHFQTTVDVFGFKIRCEDKTAWQAEWAGVWGWWLAGLVLFTAQKAYHRWLCGSSLSLLLLPFPSFSSLDCSSPPILSLLPSALSASLLLLNATSGGFSYSRMQSSPKSPLSYSLHQGPRARTQSSDINEALYNLDRVLHGKSAAYVHGCVCRLWWTVYPSLVFWIQLRCVSHTVFCHLALNVSIFADVQA